ncbi:MAG: tRNA (adenosine(37)-N6)-threonylcarbamoyltransferase complex transferase subunit TsaD [Alphaproteobacteria bacterium]|nr:tRNA (adenosine(37)-N6)-threonylcarbamoyltransferase complex transferase subunit TsaD [Alphaproteobacteria bacterium]
MVLVLGIETSCDDTAAAVVRRLDGGACDVLSNEVWTEHADHRPYGGIVPEIAARSHVERIDAVIARAMAAAGVGFADLDAIAATAGPGLVGGVMVGLTAGKALALAHGKSLIPVNHLEGHALSVRMTERAAFPYLLLLISGGHTQLIRVDGVGRYQRLGTTIDDAAGEAFDKTAKLLGLAQPGGPAVEQAARKGRPYRFDFPAPLARRAGCDFSLAGLKTAVRLAAEAIPAPTPQDVADLAASFQSALAAHIAARTGRAMTALEEDFGAERQLVVAGGVAANEALRGALSALADERGWRLLVPPAKYCADNGAMIAWAGAERIAAGSAPAIGAALSFAPRARWPLAPPPTGRAHGGGRKGPKA